MARMCKISMSLLPEFHETSRSGQNRNGRDGTVPAQITMRISIKAKANPSNSKSKAEPLACFPKNLEKPGPAENF